MFKYVKIISLVIITLLFFSSISVFATDINMNLSANASQNTTNNTTTNTTTTLTAPNSLTAATDNTVNNETSTTLSQSDADSYIPRTTTVTSTSSVEDEGLGITNILNILLIVVGFVLILLGIAIIIRIHS